MPVSLPLMEKTPFQFDSKPLREASSPHAGALATSRVFRSLGFPELIDSHLPLRQRRRGFSEAQMIESVVLLQTIGGDCPEDIHLLAGDGCLERGLGYQPPKPTALRGFLERFHDESLEQQRPPREQQLSFIVPSSAPVQGLQQVLTGGVQRTAALYEQHGQRLSIATIDQDATIVESHKRAAYAHYQGGRGYQPMIALWAEADLIVADQFRDGNVPAKQEPLTCCQMAFEALPETVNERYFRGDSACYENNLLDWLSSPQREKESGGRIGFAVSAMMSPQLAQTIAEIPDTEWTTYDTEPDGTLRQWAEVVYVPSKEYEHKYTQPLRYVGLRLLKAQGVLFADGSDRHHYAVVTNLDWDAARLLQWHREKAGTVEHAHDELKNGLAAGHMPSQRFAVNATWLKLAILSYNIASAIKGLCFSPRGAHRAVQKVPPVAGPRCRTHEPQQLCDAAAAVCRRADHRAHRGGMEGVLAAHPGFAHQALAACGLADSARPSFSFSHSINAIPVPEKAPPCAEYGFQAHAAGSERPSSSV